MHHRCMYVMISSKLCSHSTYFVLENGPHIEKGKLVVYTSVFFTDEIIQHVQKNQQQSKYLLL